MPPSKAPPLSRLRLLLLLHRRHPLSSTATTAAVPAAGGGGGGIFSPKKQSHATLTLLKSQSTPSQILSTALSASLSPASPLDRTALSIAVSKLTPTPDLLHTLLTSLVSSNPRFLSLAITHYGNASMLDNSISLFTSHPNLFTLNALLSASIAANQPHLARKFFYTYTDQYHISPNLDTYDILINSCAASGEASLAYKVLDEMAEKGIKPTLQILCSALAGFYKEERFQDVKRVLEMMKGYGWERDVATYNVRVEGLCKLKRSGEARELVEEMGKRGVRANYATYSSLVIGFCKEGDVEEAKVIYDEMKRKGFVAGSGFYFMLVYHLCEAEEFGMALGICREIWDRNWVPCFSTMKMLVRGLAGEGKVEEARDIIEKMKNKFPSSAQEWEKVEDGLPL